MASFEVGEHDFLLDGAPHQIRSGAIHYFRVHPSLWEDRIRQARLMGLNAIETYVAWNVHEPDEGAWGFDGNRDLGAFLDAIAAQGMHAIVRPGPYICAEWDNGGLPGWLTAIPDIALRCSDARYLEAVEGYLERVLEHVVPRQVPRGGPVLMVQVENEYGAYGNDKVYLRSLVSTMRRCGLDTPLFTCDQANDEMLERGGLPELLHTATFGSGAEERLAVLRRHQPTGPLMCVEFWNGWFDNVGEAHHVASADRNGSDIEYFMASGASFNLYMFHGGTNQALWNGANDRGYYRPVVTSYDYDAPLAEDGTVTDKWWALRDVIERHVTVPQLTGADVPAERALAPRAEVCFHAAASFDSMIDAEDGEWVASDTPPTFDDAGLWQGLGLYRADLPADAGVLAVGEIRDRAWVRLDGEPIAEFDRASRKNSAPVPRRGGRLDVLVESRGRVNYGPRLGEPKGIVGGVRTARGELRGWRFLPLSLASIEGRIAVVVREQRDADGPIAGPVVVFGSFELDQAADAFLSVAGWGCGWVWINGAMIGRYTREGPARTLYIPAPLLRAGRNEVTVLELASSDGGSMSLVGAPDLGPTDS
nr:beta-galactosidase family protein [Demequina lutea]